MKRLMALVLLCGLSLASQASLNLIDWNAGGNGTTYQEWLFDTDTNPTIVENPYGNAVAKVHNALDPEAYSWANGVWSGSSFSLTIDIPNNPVANKYKEILVEVVYQGDIVLSWAKNADKKPFEKRMSYDIDLGNGWTKRTDLWYIEPNPNSERLCYGFNETNTLAAVDSILVSTICAPEPATMLLLSLGAIVLRKKK